MFKEFILLKDHGSFKEGQVIRLGEIAASMLLARGIVKPCASKPLVGIPPRPRPELIDIQIEKEGLGIKKKRKRK